MAIDAGDSLVQALHDHNPWWERGTDAFSLPARQKSDFYHLTRPGETGSQFEDQQLLGLVGRRGVGKTTLIHEFVNHRIKAGDAPERFLYLPFDDDPLYQLQSDEQLRRAVRYYQSRILGRVDVDGPTLIFLDDVHRIEHPNKPSTDGWGKPVSDLIREDDDRHLVVTASADVQVERELERVGISESTFDIQPILPEKFRDYIFTLYPELEDEDTRLSPTSIRTGERSLPRVLETGELEPLIDELRAKYEQVAHAERKIQSQVVDYLAMGGTISYDQDGVVESAGDLDEADYRRLRENIRDALYQEVPGFESIQTIADLERLCALAARNRGTEPFRYQDLVELFDVDRRTIADSYLPALEQLFLMSGVTEYDNSRPRSVRLYLRDTGLVTALADGDASVVRNNFEREADLARVAGFDHTMRFSYGINAMQGNDEWPNVAFWRGREGEVDYVFEVNGDPVPIGLAFRSGNFERRRAALDDFLATYDVPVGFILGGDTVRSAEPVEQVQEGIVQIPYWFFLLLC